MAESDPAPGRGDEPSAGRRPAKKVPAKKAPARKAPARKVPAKKVPAKKVPAKKALRDSAANTSRPEADEKAQEQRPGRPATGRPATGRPATGRPANGPQGGGTPSIENLLDIALDMGRAVLGPGAEEKVSSAVAFLRRRLTGDYEVDLFGFDRELTETVLLPILRPVYAHWFRVEVRGVENIPASGPALVVANHSGTIPLDSLMTQVAVHDKHPARRHLRMLGADLVFKLPVVADLARKSGTTLACNEDTERLFAAGEVVGVWPEGFKGIGKPFSERYKLQRFGRGGFVSAAIRAGVPIVPCSIVGAEETYPLIANIEPLARLLGLPYVPVTPTFPWLGPFGLIPLPSKWIIQFGTPIPTTDYGADGADDPMLVFDLTDRVRETIQHTLYTLLTERGSTFR